MIWTETRPAGWPMPDSMERPGRTAWLKGGTRGAMETINQAAGYPCYCASVWTGGCDFCTGIAALDGVRAEEQRRRQTQEGTR